MKNRIDKGKIDELRRGSHQAFQDIFIAYFRNVRFFIYSFIKSENDAEELAQDVFMKIWENHQSIDTNKSFDSYLYTIARNSVFNFLKHKLVENSYKEYTYSAKTEFVSDPENILFAKEIELLIEMTVEKMPERRAEIYRLSRVKGLKNEEIAKELSISKKTVENQLSLAISELKKTILLFMLLFLIN